MIIGLYRASNRLHSLGIPLAPRLLSILIRVVFAAHLPPDATIGRGCRIAYGGAGLVIHRRAVIGDNCLLSPGVIIGGRSGAFQVPIIGNGVSIFPGAKILGPVKIGDGAVIGANVVVVEDVQAGERVVVPKPRRLGQ